jgi:hypothetical protein
LVSYTEKYEQLKATASREVLVALNSSLGVRFYEMVMRIPMLSARVNAMIALHELPQSLELVEQDLEVLCQACQELKEANKLPTLFNFMRKIIGEINKVQCKGFSVTELQKIETTKLADGTTFLVMLVAIITRHQDKLLTFANELRSLKRAKELDIQEIKGIVNGFENQMKQLKAQADCKERYKFSEAVGSFHANHADMVAELKKLLTNTTADIAATGKQFGERNNFISKEFFVSLWKFSDDFQVEEKRQNAGKKAAGSTATSATASFRNSPGFTKVPATSFQATSSSSPSGPIASPAFPTPSRIDHSRTATPPRSFL